MNLLQAFRLAKHAITKNKNDSLRKHVLLDHDELVACDGEVTTIYQLDEDTVINAAVSYPALAPLVSQAIKIESITWDGGGSTLNLMLLNEGGGTAVANLSVLPASQFKSHRTKAVRDVQTTAADHSMLPTVVDFCGDDPTVPQFDYVHVTPDAAVATDQKSAAVVTFEPPWTLPWDDWLLPARLFSQWPKESRVHIGRLDHGALVKFDDEIRYAPAVKRKGFPDVVGRLLPHTPYQLPAVVVDTKALTSAIKRATGSSSLDIVWLTHMGHTLSVRAHTEGGGLNCVTTLQCDYSSGDSERPEAFDGKRILKALKACHNPVVLLSQPHRNAPLRFESGRFVAAIWPMDMETYGHGQADSN